MTGRISQALVAFTALLLVIGPAGSEAQAGTAVVRGTTETVKISGHYGSFSFHPKVERVSDGTKVVWKNPTGANHTVTAYGHGWSKDTSLSTDDSTSFRFQHSGTFKYYCTIHGSLVGTDCSDMCGKIVVH